MYDTIENFRSHKSNAEGIKNMDAIRSALTTVAMSISSLCPEGRELALARTKLEEAMFWANAAIARQGEDYEVPSL